MGKERACSFSACSSLGFRKAAVAKNLGELSLTTNVKFRFPGYLDPSACIMLRSIQVRGDEEPLVLSEQLRSPLGIDRIRCIDEAVRDRTAAW